MLPPPADRGPSRAAAFCTLLALAPVAAWTSAAWAQAPRPAPAAAPAPMAQVVDLEYVFTVSGLRAFRATGTLKLDGDRYLVDTKFNKEGIVSALSATFNGQNRVWGRLGGGILHPASGWSWIQFKKHVRTWQVTYRGDGTYGEEHKPPFQPKSYKTVSPDEKRGAMDPLTAAVSGAFSGAGPCNRVYPIFDSKRRFDVTLRQTGTEPLKNGDIRGVSGTAVVCEAVMKRIAGYEEERLKQDAYEKEPPRLWFATLDKLPRMLPVKMEMATSFGTLEGKLASYAVRPLTAEDRQAMSR